jgi:hypothetical protein
VRAGDGDRAETEWFAWFVAGRGMTVGNYTKTCLAVVKYIREIY